MLGAMDFHDANIYSFIIKIWLEKGTDQSGNAVWHGYMTHIPSGARHYLRDVNDVVDIMRAYFANLHQGPERRMRRFLRPIKVLRRKRDH